MNAQIRLDFGSGQLELGGVVIGRFLPRNRTEGSLQLGTCSYTYVIRPQKNGQRIEVYQSRQSVAVRDSDFHDGVFTLSVGDDVEFDLNDGILFGPNGSAGTVAFTDHDLTMEFNSLVPAESVGLVAALVALDTMWANLVGFTRTRPPTPRDSR